MTRSVRVRVRGKVQGVGFRDWTERRAQEMALDGWVRNLPDNSVEAVMHGGAEVVERLLNELRKGPPAAHVSGLEISDDAAEGAAVAGKGFSVRY